MGFSPGGGNGSANSNINNNNSTSHHNNINNNTSSGGCCNMSLKCRCKWRCLMSSGFVFFFGCFVLFGSVATFYVWFAFTPYYYARGTTPSALGCQEDNEGSWSVGVFFGDSPFHLKPIEAVSFHFIFPVIFLFITVLCSSDYYYCVWG